MKQTLKTILVAAALLAGGSHVREEIGKGGDLAHE